MTHVIVNLGGKSKYNLGRIYNLTQMMRENGYEVSIIENDVTRQRWLSEHLGENVSISSAYCSKSSHCAS